MNSDASASVVNIPRPPDAWTAREWEYRWRALPLFLSQAVLCGGYMAWQQSWALPVALLPGLAGVLIAIVGLAFRLWGTGLLSAPTMVSMHARTDRLITQGVFQLVRHPLYLGDILIFTGYALLLNAWLAPAFALYHVLRVRRLIAYEERRLVSRWGAIYAEYCRNVPRLVPSWRRMTWAPVNWSDSLRGNSIWIGLVLGYIAAVAAGDLWVGLSPFETAGFLYAAYHFSRNTSPVSDVTAGNAAID